jgi:hypothetical protein
VKAIEQSLAGEPTLLALLKTTFLFYDHFIEALALDN